MLIQKKCDFLLSIPLKGKTASLNASVAAGARLGQVVVDNDRIAAKSIDLLKRKNAGRLTFLPLNKILKISQNKSEVFQRSFPNDLNKSTGLIGRAIDLIQFDSIYKNVFGYVFGKVQVF